MFKYSACLKEQNLYMYILNLMKKDFAFVPLNTDLYSITFWRVLLEIVEKEWALQTFGFHYKLSDSVNSLRILNVSTNDMYVITVFANEIQLCEVIALILLCLLQ